MNTMNDKQDFKMIEQQQEEMQQQPQRNIFTIRTMMRGALTLIAQANRDEAIPKDTIVAASNSVAKDEITYTECVNNVRLMNAIAASTFITRLDTSYANRILCEAVLGSLEVTKEERTLLDGNLNVLLSLVLGYSPESQIDELSLNITNYKIINEMLNVLLDGGSEETAVSVQRYKVNFLNPETLNIYINVLKNTATLLNVMITKLYENVTGEEQAQQPTEVEPEPEVPVVIPQKKRRTRRKAPKAKEVKEVPVEVVAE